MPEPTLTRRARALFGISFIFVLLAFTRWGSNIGRDPIYISDVLIVLAVVHWCLPKTRERRVDITRNPPSPSLVFSLFIAYVLLRALVSISAEPALEVARDAVPYAYGIVAFFSSRSYGSSTRADRGKTEKIVWVALIAHLVWVTPLALMHNVDGLATLPIMDAPIFQVRPDIDAAICGVTGGLLLRRLLLGYPRRAWSLVGLAVTAVTVLTLYTRAGLLAYAAALAVSAFISYAAMPKQTPRRTALILSIPAIVLIAAAVLPQTTPGQRLIATIHPATATSQQQENAVGTTQARQTVWKGVISWVDEENTRIIFGSGFGNDFLSESGTLQYLEGTEYTNVRSPHDWFVGTYARMGLIGVTLAVLICLGLLRLIFVQRKFVGGDELQSLSALLVVTILIIASLGVVLESPFGAIPFFWAAGIIYASRARSSAAAPIAVSSADRSARSPEEQAPSRVLLTRGRARASARIARIDHS